MSRSFERHIYQRSSQRHKLGEQHEVFTCLSSRGVQNSRDFLKKLHDRPMDPSLWSNPDKEGELKKQGTDSDAPEAD